MEEQQYVTLKILCFSEQITRTHELPFHSIH